MSDPPSTASPNLNGWLVHAVRQGASDLHLVAGHPPILRVHGQLQPLQEDRLEADQLCNLLEAICLPETLAEFHQKKNVDFAFQLSTGDQQQRFRVNLFRAAQNVGACFRVIPSKIPTFDWAGFPLDIATRLVQMRNGLVLISGVTGSGKSTTLAMLVQTLNEEGGHRVITVEEPIEFIFPRRSNSVVTQREVGVDVDSFADGLKYGLRQDPDVILVGEIRDRETAQMALSAAETGHLVYSTLHARDAKGAISRYVDLFPQSVQSEIRAQLALSMRAVISQHLLPSSVEGQKRELALEIMFNSAPIASAIRFGKIESIDNNILTGRAEGMLLLDESIKRLLQAKRIRHETAARFVTNPSYLT